MSKRKITELTSLSVVDNLDLIAIVDVDEPVLENQTKKVSISALLNSLGSSSPLTSKGDLYTYDTTNTRLPVGADGYILSANSSEETGLEWIESPGLPYVEINYTGTLPVTDGLNTIAIGQGTSSAATTNDVILIGDAVTASGTTSQTIGIGSNIDLTDTSNSVVIGDGAGLTAGDAIAIGQDTSAGFEGVSIGWAATADADAAIALGPSSNANGNECIVIGSGSSVSNSGSTGNILIGADTYVEDVNDTINAIAIGYQAGLEHNNAIVIGANSFMGGESSIGIGNNVNTSSVFTVNVGAFSNISTDSGSSVAIGPSAAVGNTSPSSVAIGSFSAVGSESGTGIAIGYSAQVGNFDTGAIAIGNDPSAFFQDTIAIGTEVFVSGGIDSIGIGSRNRVIGPSQLAVGSDNTLDDGTSTVYASGQGNQAFGEQNNILDSRQVMVVGQQNTITGLANSIIFGEDNILTGGQNVAATDSNMFNNIQLGNQNSIVDIVQGDTKGGRIQIGRGNQCNATNSPQSIQIGEATIIRDNCEDSIAIGTNAEIGLGAAGAVQIGIGTNIETNTLAFRATKIADSAGVMIPLDAGAPTIVVDDGHIRIDNVNDDLYYRSGGSWVAAASKIPYQTTGLAPTTSPANGTLVLDNDGVTTTLWARANGAWVALASV